MSPRLSKIVTRQGDDGSTGLGDGSRISKDDIRIDAIGSIDELNSTIGMVLSHDLPEHITTKLNRIQHELFELGAELCLPEHKTISATHITELEQDLEQLNQDLPSLQEFILPAGGKATSCCHLARTVCRRAERIIVTLAKQQQSQADPIGKSLRAYINRLSDLLFVIARVLARFENGHEVLWKNNKNS